MSHPLRKNLTVSIELPTLATLRRIALVFVALGALSACGGADTDSPASTQQPASEGAPRVHALKAPTPIPMAADPHASGAVGNFFVPYAMTDIEAVETPISLGYLNDHVAGSRGQIRNVSGKLFVGSDRIRLYGVNLFAGATMPSKADAIKTAARLRKEGFNAVRLISWDQELDIPDTWSVSHRPQGLLNEDQTLNAAALDYFDHFVHQLQQAGIYVLIPLHSGRVYKQSPECFDACEGLDIYLPELIQAQKDLTAALLNHVNPYTGRAYRSDPGVYALEINNENSLAHRWSNQTIDKYVTDPALYPKYGAPLEAKWRAWVQTKYVTASAAGAAWGKPLASFADLRVPLRTDATISAALYRDWYEFHTGVDAAYLSEMIGYVKNTLGATSLVMGSQAHYLSMLSRQASDIADFHSYFGPKGVAQGFEHTNGQPVFKVDNLSVLSYADAKGSGFFGVHEYKDPNKPSMISEYVTRMGSQYVAETEPLVSAYAGFQDIDAIFLTDAQQMNQKTSKMYYSGFTNVSVAAVSRVAAVLSFRRGDVTPGEPHVLRKTRDSILTVATSSRNMNPTNVSFGGESFAPLTRNMYQQVVDSPLDETVVKGGAPVDGVYTSTTGQMVWKPQDRITFDTPMTKTAIGFFRNSAVELGSGIRVSVGNTMNNYAVVQVTSLVKGAVLPSSKMLLSLAGYFTVPGEYPRAPGAKLFSWGDDYPRIEAVPATVRIATVNTLKVTALDASGARKVEVPVVAGSGYAEFVTGPAFDTGWYLIEVIGNAVPTATLKAPAETLKGVPVALEATATDGDGTVAKVEFYEGGTLIGTDTSAPYGMNWTPATAGVRVLTVKATDNQGATTTSAAANVTVYASNTAPSVSWEVLPATGTVGVQTYLSASAGDTDGRVVKVEFFAGDKLIDTDTTVPYSTLWTPVTGGAHSMTVRATDNLGAVTVSTARTTNVSGGNALPTVSLTAPSTGTVGTALTLSATAADSDGTVAKVEFYAGATLIGSDTTSPYGLSWTPATVGTYSLTAKATDNKGATKTSAAVSVSVSAANVAPTVSLTAPSTGTVGTALTLSATAADSDGTVAKVEFYAGATLIGSDTAAPYSLNWTPPSAGTHSLTAKATDNKGATKTSAAVSVSVSAANVAPTVSLTAPSTGTVGTALTLSATAADSDGTVAKVEFYAGATLIGSDTAAPYSMSWTPATAGSYSLTAKATDNKGAVTTSAAVSVSVSAANVAPTVSLTAPSTGTVGTALTLSATAADSDGTVAKVEFFAGATLIGSDTTAPYSLSWTPAIAGTYSLTAKATDNKGAVTTSAVVSVSVSAANVAPTVSLSAPAGVVAGTPVTLTAAASDSDGTIAKVEFFDGSTVVGSDTTAPYSVTWATDVVGTHTLTARATDNRGAVTTSAAVTVTVRSGAGFFRPDAIALSAPPRAIVGRDVDLVAEVKESVITIARVEFYEGTTLIGSDEAAPYVLGWRPARTGVHRITAKAFDASGDAYLSNFVRVNSYSDARAASGAATE